MLETTLISSVLLPAKIRMKKIFNQRRDEKICGKIWGLSEN